jgi:ABC-type sugar transport system ATPase subunit
VTALLAATGLFKSYGGVQVLRDVGIEIRAGETHALVGENGAGKSTLIKLLTGAVRQDGGEVRLLDAPLAAGDPRLSRARGISCVYQEFTLVPDMTVAENIVLGREPGFLLRRREMEQQARRRLDELGARCQVTDLVRHLSVAEQQLVEIARALETDARVLILDEPTAALSEREAGRLFDVVRRLCGRGLGVLYVSHRFAEIFAIADRISVLRDGRLVAAGDAGSMDRAQLIRLMVGRDVSEEYPQRSVPLGPAVLEVTGPVPFTVRAGEVLGIGGLVGSGRTSLALALAGARRRPAVDVLLDGVKLNPRTPAEALAAGIAYLTEDRKTQGLFPQMSAMENLTVSHLRQFARRGLLDVRQQRAAAEASARAVAIRGISLDQTAGTLSGGTQQKVLFGRLTLKPPRVLLLDEPTRGVDVGARAEIYTLMNTLAAQGVAIVMISSDLPELLGMSDRILVMRDGQGGGELRRGEASAERIMSMATHT